MQNNIYNFEPTDGEDYTSFNEIILQSAQATATKVKFENKGWFHFSKYQLLPTITRRDELLHFLRTAPLHAKTGLKQALSTAQDIVTDTISLAKATWSAHLAEQVHAMRFTPKQAWKAVRVLVGGRESHHVKPVVMRMRLPNGTLASTDAENASVLAPHFEKVYTADRPVTWDVISDIEPRATVDGINGPIGWDELKLAVRHLANGKSPGLNDVPPDAFKALSNQNLDLLHSFLNAYWRGEIDFSEWHEGRVIPVPKSGDLSDPNKWRGVTLMDMGSKIFSSILCRRLFKIIDKHGVKYQFGSTPGVGCQDGSFTIKTMLHLRHNHNLPTWVLFADLVKAFDTSNHALMDKLL